METKQIKIRTIDEMVKLSLANKFNVYSEQYLREVFTENWLFLAGKVFVAVKNKHNMWTFPKLPGIKGRVDCKNLEDSCIWTVI